ncbi:MAG: TniB family NTP-binding protein [Pyrinomonadaceae bacterium]
MCEKNQSLISELKEMSVAQRQMLVERIYVKFPKLDYLYAKIKHCLEYSKVSAEPECMVIKGPLGSGKTTLIRAFARDYPRQVTEEKTIVPVLSLRVPIPASVKSLVEAMLFAFGDKAFNKGTTTRQTIRLRGYIEDCETQLIVFDEFQHFMDRDSLKVLKTLSDWLKNLIDDTRKPIIMVGMPSCDAVLDEAQNEQLKRRFSTRECLEPFGWGNTARRDELRKFLKLLDEQLPLLECSHLSDFNTAYLIHMATSGTIAYIMKLVRRATILALDDKVERLDQDHLAQAYEELLATNNPTVQNPFGVCISKHKRKRAKKASATGRTTSNRVKGRKKDLTPSDVLKKR